MPAHPTVRIDDDLPAGDAGIAHRPADDETPGGVHKDLHLGGDHLCGQHRQDDVFINTLPNLGMRDIRRVLRADQDGIHFHRFAVLVLDGHLGFPVRAQPVQAAVLAHRRHLARHAVRQVDGHGHQHRGLIAGVAKHHPLVAGADRLDLFVGQLARLGFQSFIDAEGDIRALVRDRGEHPAGIPIETF